MVGSRALRDPHGADFWATVSGVTLAQGTAGCLGGADPPVRERLGHLCRQVMPKVVLALATVATAIAWAAEELEAEEH